MTGSQFTIFGNKYPMGSYILFIRISNLIQLTFGRFQQCRLFTIPEGHFLYIGSALGRSGNPLARRLVRHASRSGEKHPHAIRSELMQLFSTGQVTANNFCEPSKKKLHWHIDYLLDYPAAEIEHIVIIRSPVTMEHSLATFLSALHETSPLAPRLGAQDTRNSTHILQITDQKQILEKLGQYIPLLIDQSDMQ